MNNNSKGVEAPHDEEPENKDNTEGEKQYQPIINKVRLVNTKKLGDILSEDEIEQAKQNNGYYVTKAQIEDENYISLTSSTFSCTKVYDIISNAEYISDKNVNVFLAVCLGVYKDCTLILSEMTEDKIKMARIEGVDDITYIFIAANKEKKSMEGYCSVETENSKELYYCKASSTERVLIFGGKYEPKNIEPFICNKNFYSSSLYRGIMEDRSISEKFILGLSPLLYPSTVSDPIEKINHYLLDVKEESIFDCLLSLILASEERENILRTCFKTMALSTPEDRNLEYTVTNILENVATRNDKRELYKIMFDSFSDGMNEISRAYYIRLCLEHIDRFCADEDTEGEGSLSFFQELLSSKKIYPVCEKHNGALSVEYSNYLKSKLVKNIRLSKIQKNWLINILFDLDDKNLIASCVLNNIVSLNDVVHKLDMGTFSFLSNTDELLKGHIIDFIEIIGNLTPESLHMHSGSALTTIDKLLIISSYYENQGELNGWEEIIRSLLRLETNYLDTNAWRENTYSMFNDIIQRSIESTPTCLRFLRYLGKNAEISRMKIFVDLHKQLLDRTISIVRNGDFYLEMLKYFGDSDIRHNNVLLRTTLLEIVDKLVGQLEVKFLSFIDNIRLKPSENSILLSQVILPACDSYCSELYEYEIDNRGFTVGENGSTYKYRGAYINMFTTIYSYYNSVYKKMTDKKISNSIKTHLTKVANRISAVLNGYILTTSDWVEIKKHTRIFKAFLKGLVGYDDVKYQRLSNSMDKFSEDNNLIVNVINKYGIVTDTSSFENMYLIDIKNHIYNGVDDSTISRIIHNKFKYLTKFLSSYYDNFITTPKTSPEEIREALDEATNYCTDWFENVKNMSCTIQNFLDCNIYVESTDLKPFVEGEEIKTWDNIEKARLFLRKREAYKNLHDMVLFAKIPEDKTFIELINSIVELDDATDTIDSLFKHIKAMDEFLSIKDKSDVIEVLSVFYNISELKTLMDTLNNRNIDADYASACLSSIGSKSGVVDHFASLGKLNTIRGENNINLMTFMNKFVRIKSLTELIGELTKLSRRIKNSNLVEDLELVTKNSIRMYEELNRYLKGDIENNLETITNLVTKNPDVEIRYDGDYTIVLDEFNELEDTKFRIEELLVTSNLLVTNDNKKIEKIIEKFRNYASDLNKLSELVATSYREGFSYFCKLYLSNKNNGRYALQLKFGESSNYLISLNIKIEEWRKISKLTMKKGSSSNIFRSIPKTLIFYILYLTVSSNRVDNKHILNITHYLRTMGISYEDFIKKLRDSFVNSKIDNWEKRLRYEENDPANEDLDEVNMKLYKPLMKLLMKQFNLSVKNYLGNPLQYENNNLDQIITHFRNSSKKVLYYSARNTHFFTAINFFRLVNKKSPRFFELLICNRKTSNNDIDTFIDSCKDIDINDEECLNEKFIINPNYLKTEQFKYLDKKFSETTKDKGRSFVIIQLQGAENSFVERDFSGTLPAECKLSKKDIDIEKLREWFLSQPVPLPRKLEIVRSLHCGVGKTTYITNCCGDKKTILITLNIMDADKEMDLVNQLQNKCNQWDKTYILHVILTLSFGKLDKFLPFLYQLIYMDYISINSTLFNLENIKAVYIECREFTYNLVDILALPKSVVKEISYDKNKISDNYKVTRKFKENYAPSPDKSIADALIDLFFTVNAKLNVNNKANAEKKYETLMREINSYRLLKMYMKLMNYNYDIVNNFIEFLDDKANTKDPPGKREQMRKTERKNIQRFIFLNVLEMAPINPDLLSMNDLCQIRNFNDVIFKLENTSKKMIFPKVIIWINKNMNVLPPIVKEYKHIIEELDPAIQVTLEKLPLDKKLEAQKICNTKTKDKSMSLFKEVCFIMGRQDVYFELKKPDNFMNIFDKTEKVDIYKEWNIKKVVNDYIPKDSAKKLLSNYVFTYDNTSKMLFIYLKMINRLPVILIGETGVGKTELLNKLQEISGLKMKTLQIHSETTLEELKDIVFNYDRYGLKEGEAPPKDDGYMGYKYIFFDEANTSPLIQKIEELVISRSLDGKKIDKNISFLVAVNPYRMLNKNERELYSDFERPKPRGMVNDPSIENKVAYTVKPLPLSFQSIAFNFKELDKESYLEYGRCIMKNAFNDGKKRIHSNNTEEILQFSMNIIKATKKFMDKNNYVISLRELSRMKTLIIFFLKSSYFKGIVKNEREAILLSAYIVFAQRLSDAVRKKYMEYLKKKIKFKDFTMSDVYYNVRDGFLKGLTAPKGIALNDSLKGNIFSMILAILTRIPLVIIGKPGTSKSLAMVILDQITNQNGGKKFRQLPRTTTFTYQGSKNSTAKGIKRLHESAVNFSSRRDKLLNEKYEVSKLPEEYEHVTIFQFDEIGLAEQGGKRNALKILHYILEVKNKEDHYATKNGSAEVFSKIPAFIGISNYALDQAKTNRCLIFCKGDLTDTELKDTALGIENSYNLTRHGNSIITNRSSSRRNSRIIQNLDKISKGHSDNLEEQKKLGLNFIGSRNFYTLIVDILENRSTDLKKVNNINGSNIGVSWDIKKLITKSYDVYTSPDFPSFNPYECFNKAFNNRNMIKVLNRKQEEEMILRNLSSSTGRHIMLLVDDVSTVLRIVTESRVSYLKPKAESDYIHTTVIMPTKKADFVSKSIQEIITLMSPDYEKKMGQQIVVMLKCDEVYPSLFPLLNRNYGKNNNKYHVKVAIHGSGDRIRYVSPYFRVFTILFQDEINNVDPAFINRFELRNFTLKNEINFKLNTKEYINNSNLLRDCILDIVAMIGKVYPDRIMHNPLLNIDINTTAEFKYTNEMLSMDNNITLYSLVENSIKNSGNQAYKIKNDLLMLIEPRIRIELKRESKEPLWALSIISLSDAIDKLCYESERTTPVTVIFVDVYKNKRDIEKLLEDKQVCVFDDIDGNDKTDTESLMNWNPDDKSTLRVYVPDYTKSTHDYVNRATIKFYQKYGTEYRLVIITKMNERSVRELYIAPSEIISYWYVSTDYLEDPFLISEYNEKELDFNRGLLYVLPEILTNQYGPLLRKEKKIIYRGIMRMLNDGSILENLSDKYMKKCENSSEIRRLTEKSKQKADKTDTLRKKAMLCKNTMCEVVNELVKKIKDAKLLIPNNIMDEFTFINIYLEDRELRNAASEINTEYKGLFTKPFLYDKVEYCLKNKDYYNELLNKIFSYDDDCKGYLESLIVAYVLRNFINAEVDACIPLVKLSSINPDKITDLEYERMYTIITRSFGFREEQNYIKVVKKLNEESDANVLRILKYILNILYETRKIMDENWNGLEDINCVGTLYLISIIKNQLNERALDSFDFNWMASIMKNISTFEFRLEYAQVNLVLMLKKDDNRYEKFLQASDMKGIWEIIKSFDVNYKDDFIPFTKKYIDIIERINMNENGKAICGELKPVIETILTKIFSLMSTESKELTIYFTIFKNLLEFFNKNCMLRDVLKTDVIPLLATATKEKQNSIIRQLLLCIFDSCNIEVPLTKLPEFFMSAMDSDICKLLDTPDKFIEQEELITKLEKVLSNIIKANGEAIKEVVREKLLNITGNDITTANDKQIDCMAVLLKFLYYNNTVPLDLVGKQSWLKNKLGIKNVKMVDASVADLNYNPFNLNNLHDFDDSIVQLLSKNDIIGNKDDINFMLKLAHILLRTKLQDEFSEEDACISRNKIIKLMGGNREFKKYFPMFIDNTKILNTDLKEQLVIIFVSICRLLALFSEHKDTFLEHLIAGSDDVLDNYYIPIQSPSKDEKLINDMLLSLKGIVVCNGNCEGEKCDKIILTIDSSSGDPVFGDESSKFPINPKDTQHPNRLRCKICGHTSDIGIHTVGTFVAYSNYRKNLQEGIDRIRNASIFRKGLNIRSSDIDREDDIIRKIWGENIPQVYIIMAVITALRCGYHWDNSDSKLKEKLIKCFEKLGTYYNSDIRAGFTVCCNMCGMVINRLCKIQPPSTQEILSRDEQELINDFRQCNMVDAYKPTITENRIEPNGGSRKLYEIIEHGFDRSIYSMIIGAPKIDYDDNMFANNGIFIKYLKDNAKIYGRKINFLLKLATAYNTMKIYKYLRCYIVAQKKLTSLIQRHGNLLKSIRDKTLEILDTLMNDTFDNNEKEILLWFNSNRGRILSFFKSLYKLSKIAYSNKEGQCGSYIYVPQFNTYNNITIESILPLSKQTTNVESNKTFLGYPGARFCIERQNDLIDELNRRIDSSETINKYNKVSKVVKYDDLNEVELVELDLEDLVKRNLVRTLDEHNIPTISIDLSGMESDLYETTFKNIARIDASEFNELDNLINVDFVYPLNNLGRIHYLPFDGTYKYYNRVIEILENLEQAGNCIKNLIDRCIDIIFTLNDKGFENYNPNRKVLDCYSKDIGDKRIHKILEKINVGVLFYFYEYIEDKYGDIYIMHSLPGLFKDTYNDNLQELKTLFNRQDVVMVCWDIIMLIRRVLIRECIPYNKLSLRKEFLTYKMDVENAKLEVYMSSTSPDYYFGQKYYPDDNTSFETLPDVVKYILNAKERGGETPTVYNMYSLSQKLNDIITSIKTGNAK